MGRLPSRRRPNLDETPWRICSGPILPAETHSRICGKESQACGCSSARSSKPIGRRSGYNLGPSILGHDQQARASRLAVAWFRSARRRRPWLIARHRGFEELNTGCFRAIGPPTSTRLKLKSFLACLAPTFTNLRSSWPWRSCSQIAHYPAALSSDCLGSSQTSMSLVFGDPFTRHSARGSRNLLISKDNGTRA